MKSILISLFLISSLYSDEMKRIEAIVQDITELRSDYEKCKDELKSSSSAKFSAVISKSENFEKLYNEEKKKNISLKAKINSIEKIKNSNEVLSREIQELKKELNVQKKISETKNKTIQKFMNESLACKEENKFPKLMMKEDINGSTEFFKPTSFYLISESAIYDDINGQEIDTWVQSRSFTSNQKRDGWIKITGYFVDKKWRSAKKSMWIKSTQVLKK